MPDHVEVMEIDELPSTSLTKVREFFAQDDCDICNSPAATLHYGAMTCGSCKVFFLRTSMAKRVFLCDKGGRCEYPRDRCRACRFQKCLKMGMNPEAVGRRKQLIASAKENEEDQLPDLSIVPYFTEKSAARSRSYHLEAKKFDNPTKIVSHLLGIERFCDNEDTGKYSSYENFDFTLDVDLSEALQFPGKICRRTPIGFSSGLQICAKDPSSLFRQLYCRLTLHMLDWVVSLDEIWMMSEKDRVRLISRQAANCVVLTMAYNTYRFDASGVLFCHGFQLEKTLGDSPDANDFSTVMVDFAHSQLLSVFREIHLSPEEYVLLKCISFFTTVGHLSDEATEIVRNARRRYEYLLAKHIEEERPNFSPTARAIRVMKILGLLPKIMKMAIFDDQYLAKMAALDLQGMRGRITRDFHLSD
ncbi:unnamed protein product, partial [Mesorhabditis belari]|uniref:Uncharacterized protein n=1 Tax=Mesorhabditis belari TaxID=2138241 RepID=A0AAF3EIK5_9BILA